nr:MAG TPA: hypothetical protein [Caudoviricetes sp.]
MNSLANINSRNAPTFGPSPALMMADRNNTF